MSDPKWIEELERRIQKLEHDHNDIVESEKLLLKLSKYHRAGLQELNGKIERLELIQGDTNERLDKIERTLESYDKRFDRIEQRFDRVEATMATKQDLSELEGRFDQLEARFDKLEAVQSEILALLRQNQPDK
jgi:chromosome segregation ATPase